MPVKPSTPILSRPDKQLDPRKLAGTAIERFHLGKPQDDPELSPYLDQLKKDIDYCDLYNTVFQTAYCLVWMYWRKQQVYDRLRKYRLFSTHILQLSDTYLEVRKLEELIMSMLAIHVGSDVAAVRKANIRLYAMLCYTYPDYLGKLILNPSEKPFFHL